VIDLNAVGYADIPLPEREKFKLQIGDILLSHINSLKHIGKSALYKEDFDLYHGMNLMLLRAKKGKITPEYLHSLLTTTDARSHFRRFAKQAINQASLNKQDISQLEVLLPPLPEQKKIAAILSSVDDTIQTTRETIEQTKKLKQGLMQELLTKGIGHTRFKKTEIGEIPEEWRTQHLEEVAKVFSGGTPSRAKPKYYCGSIPWVKSGEVNLDEILTTSEYISEEGLNNSSARWVRNGASLIAMYGATAGQISRLRIRATINQAISAVEGRQNIVDDTFLFYALLNGARKLMNLVQGSGQPNLNGKLIKQQILALPATEEQKEIGMILSSMDSYIHSQDERLMQLQSLKKGLMQDLLTGKVRVAV